MKTKKNVKRRVLESVGADFFDRLWIESWTYIKTVVDVVREPVPRKTPQSEHFDLIIYCC